MKFNFKKISAITASVLMTGMTMGIAAAANYPAPFVSGGSADVAIVYGTGSGVSALDEVQAGSIQTNLASSVTGTSTVSVSGGEPFSLDKDSNHFNVGNALNAVYSSLDNDEMDFLADGTYDDGDIDEDFEQSITLGSNTLSLFADSKYKDDAPTLGFRWDDNDHILNYTFDLDEAITDVSDFDDTEIPLLGGSYYVLSASTTVLELLDTAEKHTLKVGETATINGKTVSLDFVSSTTTKFTVDGETTDSLNENEEFELDDGSYIVPTEIDYQDYAGGIQSATFSIGSGKLTITNGDEVQANDDDIDNLIGYFIGNKTVALEWNADGETFLGEGESITMPGFGMVSLVYGGINFPSDSETISLQSGETFTIQMDNYELPLIQYNSDAPSSQLFGEENNPLIVAPSQWNVTLSSIATQGGSNYTAAQGFQSLNVTEDDRFIVVSHGTELTDVEVAYYEVTTIEDDEGEISVELDDLIGSKDLTFDSLESKESGDISIELLDVYNTTTQAYLNFSSDDTIYFNRVVSEKGLVISWSTTASAATDGTGITLTFTEADKDEDLAQGTSFTATVKNTTNDEFHVSTHSVSGEEESTDYEVGYVISDLASKIMFDTSADENEFSVEYFGKEVTADVQVVAGGDITVGTSQNGVMLVKDTEVSSVSSKNLIVVGGSCINSAAASLVGGAYCGASFTDATGIGSGQFLIKGYDSSSITSKMALLVAGYESADTVNAATYLRTQTVDTAAEYKGTSSTSADLVVA